MKPLGLLLGLAAASLSPLLTTRAADADPRLKADSVVWAGLDYSLVRMVGPNDFRNPATIIPDMFDKWNDLFLRERLGRLGDTLRKRVTPDTAGMKERNRLVTDKQIIPSPGPDDAVEQTHITAEQIAAAVKAYQLESKEGLGLVFLVDRLCKAPQKGAVHVVFFDVKTREVIASERSVRPAGGGGFRNYWFRVIKETDETLGKYR